MVGRCTGERRHIRSTGRETKPNGFVARDGPERSLLMRKHRTFRLDLQVKVDLAACLRALVLLYLLT